MWVVTFPSSHGSPVSGVLTQLVPFQLRVTHGGLETQLVPAQVPAEHVSPNVVAFPSLHAPPLLAGTRTQLGSALSSTAWHASAAQVTGAPGAPVLQVPSVLQRP